MNTLEISSIGSACGKNVYEPRNKTMLLLLCREYKNKYKKLFFENDIFKNIDPNVKTYDIEIKKVYDEFKKDINSSQQFCKAEDKIKEKLIRENKEITQEDIERATSFIKNNLKKDCGINNEFSVISQKKYKKGNDKMYTYSENGWTIRGLHDAVDGEIVVEIKTRMRQQNVKKNEYDLYQLFGYLLSMNKTKGKIVQKYNKQIFDSDTETNFEYGIIDIDEPKWKEKFKIFKQELDNFFIELRKYSNENFDLEKVIKPCDKPIALFDSNGCPCNINCNYERIIKALT